MARYKWHPLIESLDVGLQLHKMELSIEGVCVHVSFEADWQTQIRLQIKLVSTRTFLGLWSVEEKLARLT